MKQGGRS